jgi:hypothetical protein
MTARGQTVSVVMVVRSSVRAKVDVTTTSLSALTVISGKITLVFLYVISQYEYFRAKSACSYGSVQTGVTPDRKDITFGDNIGGTSNPMVLEFNKWTVSVLHNSNSVNCYGFVGVCIQGGVKIHIDVYDDDSNNDDHVDSISTIYRGPPGQFENLLTAEARTS